MRYLQGEISHCLETEHKMCFITGPRQVGKTTLLKHILQQKNSSQGYFNWDIEKHRKEILKQSEDFWLHKFSPLTQPYIGLDEIHKYPRWKRFLKGLYDAYGQKIKILITGSGRLNVYQRGGDSLFGRYHLFHLHPLSVGESLRHEKDKILTPDEVMTAVMEPSTHPGASETLSRLEQFNGFPEPFYSGQMRTLIRWRREHRELIIREDLRDLTQIREIGLIDAMIELLPERIGSPLSLNSIREDLGVAFNTVKNWIKALSFLYYLFEIRPFHSRLARALRHEAKVYLYDGSVIQNESARFENLVALHLRKACDTWNDFGHGDFELHYIRDKEKREADFLITAQKKPWLLVECKLNQKEIDRSLTYFKERLKPPHCLQIVRHLGEEVLHKSTSGIFLCEAAKFLAVLP